jgi:two-component system, sporulation sensor kinase E
LKTPARTANPFAVVARKSHPLDRVLGRIDQLDSVNLNNLVQRLARERGLFESVLQAIQEGVLVVEESGTIAYANAAAARLVGARDDELAGQSLWRLVPGLRATLEPSLAAPVAPQTAAREIEVSYPQRRILRLYLLPFEEPHDAHPAVSRRFVVILTDVTQQILSTAELIESEKLNSLILLAGGVAHEIGNPLNSLTIHLQLIERKLRRLGAARDREDIAESLSVCREEVARLDSIVTHFLEAIRPRSPDFSDVNLGELIEEVLRFQASELENRGVRVDVSLPADLPVLLADRNQVKQALFNLTKNAMEAMPPGGTLRVRTRIDDDSLYLLIGDTGSGIRQEDLPRIFEPYHTTKKDGHGLGLMIVHRILRDHGGEVGIDSKEGVGTVVTLRFPLKHRRVRMLGEA